MPKGVEHSTKGNLFSDHEIDLNHEIRNNRRDWTIPQAIEVLNELRTSGTHEQLLMTLSVSIWRLKLDDAEKLLDWMLKVLERYWEESEPRR